MQNIYFSSFVFRNFAKNGKANFNNRNRKRTVCQRRNGSYHRQGNRLGVSQTNRGHKNDNDRPPLRQNFHTTDYETGKNNVSIVYCDETHMPVSMTMDLASNRLPVLHATAR